MTDADVVRRFLRGFRDLESRDEAELALDALVAELDNWKALALQGMREIIAAQNPASERDEEKVAQDPEQEKVRPTFDGPDRYCSICGTARGFHHVKGSVCFPASSRDYWKAQDRVPDPPPSNPASEPEGT